MSCVHEVLAQCSLILRALLVHVGPLIVTFAQERKLYVPGTTFFVAFMPECFDTIGKGMDTVLTRFDALQFKISSR